MFFIFIFHLIEMKHGEINVIEKYVIFYNTPPGETQPGETQPGETQPGKTKPGETTPTHSIIDNYFFKIFFFFLINFLIKQRTKLHRNTKLDRIIVENFIQY